MTLTEYLAQVRERVEKAPPGPWKWLGRFLMPSSNYIEKTFADDEDEPPEEHVSVLDIDTWCSVTAADFIAASRTDIPLLLAIIEEQAKALERVRQAADIMNDGPDESDEHLANRLVTEALQAQARIQALLDKGER